MTINDSTWFFYSCDEWAKDHPYCDLDGIISCVFADEITDPAMAASVKKYLERFPEYADCRYYRVIMLCPPPFFGSCDPGGWEDSDPTNDIYQGKCITNEDCSVRCAETVVDFCENRR